MGSEITDKIDTDEDSGVKKQDIPHPLNTVDSFIPEQDDIALKGNLDPTQAVLFSLAIELYKPYFPYLSEKTEEMIKNFVKEVEKRQISIRGKSREEITKIFSSIFQSYHMEETDEKGQTNLVQKMLDAEKGSD